MVVMTQNICCLPAILEPDMTTRVLCGVKVSQVGPINRQIQGVRKRWLPNGTGYPYQFCDVIKSRIRRAIQDLTGAQRLMPLFLIGRDGRSQVLLSCPGCPLPLWGHLSFCFQLLNVSPLRSCGRAIVCKLPIILYIQLRLLPDVLCL